MKKLVLLFGLFVAACGGGGGGGDVKDRKIAEIDFNNPASFQDVVLALQPGDREVFAQYMVSRQPGMPGGEVLRADGKQPETVGEAIELTREKQGPQ